MVQTGSYPDGFGMDFFSRIAILLSRASRIGSASCQNGKL
jgi:hypothetical protein